MDSLLQVFFICLALGSVVGFLAGLLGIGGGLIIVPALLYILPSVGIGSAQITHVAIATSLASIILTSMSSAVAHHKRGNIPWELFKPIFPGIVIGSLASAFVSEQIASDDLQQAFAIFVVLMAAQMAFPFKVKTGSSLPSFVVLFIISSLIALIAGLMGIGGGVLLVPFLSYCGLQMRQAVGFSSATGMLIAVSGTIGYIIAGFDVPNLPEGSVGFIYLPALIGIIISSILCAPIGVKAASSWPTPVLKKIFAGLLVVVGLKLLLS
ncbi:sulfite exporter TauE/SafE family protein [Shewanella livingstonensis]|uniref:Probable membrane transporter protein n=1 Tax=Shewanella livingstonensis TaxID=150120 RepID=A0A3G8LZT6_9GAMM|nr:sulfite exporter TauE/SafE family protein [Shewanella livingstonensis]AZG74280.1 sulfite exporter TauE/SafE family protein [Shewanella livingstonensis]